MYNVLIAKLTAGGKKGREKNVYYVRYLSIIMEHLLGKDYLNDDLKPIKSYQITDAIFKDSKVSEVPLTSHMRRVARLPEKPLNLPYEDANIEASGDMSLSGTSVHPVSEPKAKTDKKRRKKKTPSSSEPSVPDDNTKQSLEASKSAEEQENQPQTTDTTKAPDTIVREDEHNDDELHDDDKFITQTKTHTTTDAEDTLMGSRPMDIDTEFDLESMPDDDLQSFSGSEILVSGDSQHEVSQSEHTSWEKNASIEFLNLSSHLDHVCEEVSLLHCKVEEMESSIAQKVSDYIKSYVPDLISHSLKSQLPGLLSKALKDCLPRLFKESLTNFGSSKVLKTEMGESIFLKVSLGMQDVRTDLNTQTKQLSKYYLDVQNMHSYLQEVKLLLEAAVIVDDHAEGETNQRDQNVNPATIQGEPEKPKENIAIPDISQEKPRSDNAEEQKSEETAILIHRTTKAPEDTHRL
ncbi:hypothetical protein Tco_0559654 [Tanacetum coccineum]